MHIPQGKDTKVIIDNNLIEWKRWEIEHDPEHTRRVLAGETSFDKPNVIAKVRLKNDTVVEFKPEAYETTKDTVYLYGLLQALFPIIAREYMLEDWKIAYLEYKAKISNNIDRFRIQKDNMQFNTKEALTFAAGYNAANNKKDV